MRLMFITASISYGGASKMLCFVAESLSKRGHEVCVANLNNTVNVTDYERTLAKDIILKRVCANNRVEEFLGLVRITKEYKPDAIIAFLGFPNFYASIIGKILRIPAIISERGDPIRTQAKSRVKRFIFNKVINLADGAVFQTDGAMKYYGKRLQTCGTIIPNPIFVTDQFDEINEDREKTIVSVGRLDNEQKRYDVMLKAFSLFVKSFPEYTLKIYGRGTDEDIIKSWVDADSSIRDRVLFLGLTQNPMHDIAHDGIFVITSDYEGISNALLEAMAMGLPCVSTDHTPGGARLLIQDHVNGLLAPIGDYVEIAKQLEVFANDKVLAAQCGKEARKVIERFNPDKIIDSWERYVIKISNMG